MGTITKHIKTITGKGFISDQENNKVDVIYRIEIFQDFTLSGNNLPFVFARRGVLQVRLCSGRNVFLLVRHNQPVNAHGHQPGGATARRRNTFHLAKARPHGSVLDGMG